MSYDEKNLNMPTIKEAIMLADLFDGAGEYKTAALLDEFIDKSAAANGDIIKQAGFWLDMLKRLKGRTKRIFFSIYREVHEKAKEANKVLDEEIDKINKNYKKVKHHLKVYELENWRYSAQSLGLANIDNIMSAYDQTNAKLIKFLDIQSKGRPDPDAELSQIDKLPGVTPSTVPGEKETRVPGAREGWRRIHPRVTNVQANSRTGDVRIKIDGFQDYLGVHLEMVGDDTIKFIEHEGELGRLSSLKKIMGQDTWQITMTDKDWAYLTKITPKSEEEKAVPSAPEEAEKPTGFEEEPVLPGEEPKKKPELVGVPEKEGLEEVFVAPKTPEKAPEVAPEAPVPEAVPEAPVPEEAIRERVWIIRPEENSKSFYARSVARGAVPYIQILKDNLREGDRVEDDPEKLKFLYMAQKKTGKTRIPMPKNWENILASEPHSARTARMNRVLTLLKLS